MRDVQSASRSGSAYKTYGISPTWNPDEGITILEPEAPSEGYWVGSPSITFDPDRDSFLLTYRRRRPRGEGVERGWFGAVAESKDGVHFQDVWTVHKDELRTSSMERFSLFKDGGRYLLYISYVDPADNRWRIDMIESDRPDGFNVAHRIPVFTAASTQTEGVKDPYVLKVGPVFYMLVSFATPPAMANAAMHATGDIYNTGVTTCPTALATSRDGRTWTWQGEILSVGTGWDRYQARLNSVLPCGPVWIGFYDGSSKVEENYEERCGLALSHDLKRWEKVTVDHPWVLSPYRSGSIRYVDAVQVHGEVRIYYEMTRSDGSHELRMNRIAL